MASCSNINSKFIFVTNILCYDYSLISFQLINNQMSTPHLPPLSQSMSQSTQQISLYGAKMAKKQSEEELQKIQNRIALLRTEQMKLTKKIEQTDNKAYELYVIKKQQAEKKTQKIKEKQAVPPPFTYPLHLKQKETLQRIKDEEQKKRYNDAQTIRYENQNQIQQAKDELSLQMKELRDKAFSIKKQEMYSTQLAVQKLREKREKVRSEVFVEADQVFEEKLNYDQSIKQLEQQELHAINQLQMTKSRHKTTAEKLTLAKQLSPDQFAQRYLHSEQPLVYGAGTPQ